MKLALDSAFSMNSATLVLNLQVSAVSPYFQAKSKASLICSTTVCGSSLTSGASPASSFECSMPCAGNSSEVCGGPNLLTLFWTGQANPQTNPGTGPWSFAGCYT